MQQQEDADDENSSVYDYDNDPLNKLGYCVIDSNLFCGEWTLEAFRWLRQKQLQWPAHFLTTYATLKKLDISSNKEVFIETSINEASVADNIDFSDEICIILSFTFIGDNDNTGHYALLKIDKEQKTVKIYETGSNSDILPYFAHIRKIVIERKWDTEDDCILVPWNAWKATLDSKKHWYVSRRKMKSELKDNNCGPMAARMLDKQVDICCFDKSYNIRVNLDTCRADVVDDFRRMMMKQHEYFKTTVDDTFWKKNMYMTLNLCALNNEAFDSAIHHTCICQQTSGDRVMVASPCCNKRMHLDCMTQYLIEREQKILVVG